MGDGRVEGGVWGKIWEIKQKIMHFLCKIFTIFEMHPVNKGAGALTPPLNPPLVTQALSKLKNLRTATQITKNN